MGRGYVCPLTQIWAHTFVFQSQIKSAMNKIITLHTFQHHSRLQACSILANGQKIDVECTLDHINIIISLKMQVKVKHLLIHFEHKVTDIQHYADTTMIY